MDYSSIARSHEQMVSSVWDVREQQAAWMAQRAAEAAALKARQEAEAAAKEAQKLADFNNLKALVDKVYFAYTLQRADDEQLNTWTQQLVDGASAEGVVAGFRNSSASMYFGANAHSSVSSAFQTLFGRTATTQELIKYSSVDPLLIPGLIALEAQGQDALTMGVRMDFAMAVKGYYENAGIPLTYGMPMMKSKEQMLTLHAGSGLDEQMNVAVREMGDFLTEWGRVVSKPEQSKSDIESPKSEYFYTDNPTVGVAFYQPPSGASNGRILFTFNEPVDWAALDRNKDGVLTIGSELDLVLSNPGFLGQNPKILTNVGVNSLVIEIGSNPSKPSLNQMDFVTFVGISDYAGNVGGATFGLNYSTDGSPPLPSDETIKKAQLVGNTLIFRFNETINWSAVDKDSNGSLSLGAVGAAGVELQFSATQNANVANGAQVANFAANQLTIQLAVGHGLTTGAANKVVLVGVVDSSGLPTSAIFEIA